MDVNRKIHNNLLKNGIKNFKLNYYDYIFNISKFKFVISPEGNGKIVTDIMKSKFQVVFLLLNIMKKLLINIKVYQFYTQKITGNYS